MVRFALGLAARVAMAKYRQEKTGLKPAAFFVSTATATQSTLEIQI